MRRAHYLSGSGDPSSIDEGRRAAFVASALGDLHRRLHAAEARRGGRIDVLFDSLDRTVEASRAVLDAAGARLEARRRQQQHRLPAFMAAGEPAAAGAATRQVASARGSSDTAMAPLRAAAAPSAAEDLLLDELAARVSAAEAAAAGAARTRFAGTIEVARNAPAVAAAAATAPRDDFDPTTAKLDWTDIRATAVGRGIAHGDCAICLSQLRPAVDLADGPPVALPKPCALLSCGHAFHAPCIESLERYVGVEYAPEPARRRQHHAAAPMPPLEQLHHHHLHAGPVVFAPVLAPPPPATLRDDLTAAFAARLAGGAGGGAERRQPPCRCPVCRAGYVRIEWVVHNLVAASTHEA